MNFLTSNSIQIILHYLVLVRNGPENPGELLKIKHRRSVTVRESAKEKKLLGKMYCEY